MKNLLIVAGILAVVYYGKKVYDQTMYTIKDVANFAVQADDRRTGNFTEISSGVNADIEWTQGETCTIHIDAPSDYLAEIETVVEGDVLEIRHKTKVGFSWGNKSAKIKITSPTLKAISMGGSGAFKNLSRLESSTFDASLGGSGTITLVDLDLEEFGAALGGSGTINADGRTRKAKISLGGSGAYNGRGLKGEDVEATLAGSGDIECHAANSLDATLVGSGDIRYLGNARVNSTKMGSGDIERID
jgi:hypothetical protein